MIFYIEEKTYGGPNFSIWVSYFYIRYKKHKDSKRWSTFKYGFEHIDNAKKCIKELKKFLK